MTRHIFLEKQHVEKQRKQDWPPGRRGIWITQHGPPLSTDAALTEFHIPSPIQSQTIYA